ncbi:MAG TPA: hypothetical protein VMT24_18020 [Aggregatilineaceae bacterium]|nr:hypothetical protein [Aggregatilineaceae bacterium]
MGRGPDRVHHFPAAKHADYPRLLLVVDADVPRAIVILVIVLGGCTIGYLAAFRAEPQRQKRQAQPQMQG